MRPIAVSRFCTTVSVMVTAWPASANTCAMPWPISPAPMTAILALFGSIIWNELARRVAAVSIQNVAGVKIRSLGGEEEQRSGQILRFAEPALRHAGQKAFAHIGRALGVLVHPGSERRAKHRGPDGIDGDAGVAPFAAERLGDAV